MDAPLEGSFMNCGHLAVCMPCGECVMAASAVCPICAEPAEHFGRIFLCSA
jgi:rubrerythrin